MSERNAVRMPALGPLPGSSRNSNVRPHIRANHVSDDLEDDHGRSGGVFGQSPPDDAGRLGDR